MFHDAFKRASCRKTGTTVGALSLIAVLSSFALSAAASDTPITRIAFGSCAKEHKPQPIWDAINKQSPELFVFLGDNIYGDTEDMQVMRDKWAKLGAQPGYQQLKQRCQILATWDDHDYGVNDGGKHYPKRIESQQAFLDFFEEPQGTPRRTTPGIYDARGFGPAGKRVQVILLDTRYFRSDLERGERGPRGDGYPGRYVPTSDRNRTMLGTDQWRWLEQQLREPADVRIIASSIQFVANDHRFEKWGNLPHERERMLKLIAQTGANGVIFISGDRHMSELSKLEDARVGYPLFDVTSSSLNQPGGTFNEINRHRVGRVYNATNFGMLHIDWEQRAVTFEIRKEDGDVFLTHTVSLKSLQQDERVATRDTDAVRIVATRDDAGIRSGREVISE